MPAVSNNNSGVSVAATVIQPIPVPNSGSQGVITEGLTPLEDLVPGSNQFAALDVPDLSGTEEVYSSHTSLGLPDDLFEAPHASSVDIVSEIVADCVVASSQRDVSPLISVKGKSQGGGKENSENNSPATIVLGWDPSVLEVQLTAVVDFYEIFNSYYR
ncbi:hypothetical protein RHGRI_005043 [Rhododendron griersonianum]|uniref:Uncharacterized protein n=1 Tax=Rhododendron griersonianum TaxID=479676 RepID=A0AAV6LD77_9ERIC|nr:hypothetical protein RHGRI_005043 [Rhododendron griersonianum]